MNNYPEWMLTIPHPKSTTEDTEEPQNEKKIYAPNTFKSRIKEAIQIKLTKPALNRDNGYELAVIYDTILTPKRR